MYIIEALVIYIFGFLQKFENKIFRTYLVGKPRGEISVVICQKNYTEGRLTNGGAV